MSFLRQAKLVIIDKANDIQFSDMEAKKTDMGAEIRDLHKEFQQFKWYGTKHALCITHPNWSSELQNKNVDAMLLSLFNDNMDVDIEPHDISRSHQAVNLNHLEGQY